MPAREPGLGVPDTRATEQRAHPRRACAGTTMGTAPVIRKRRPGRPSVSPGEPTHQMTFRVGDSFFQQIRRRGRELRLGDSDIARRLLRDGLRMQDAVAIISSYRAELDESRAEAQRLRLQLEQMEEVSKQEEQLFADALLRGFDLWNDHDPEREYRNQNSISVSKNCDPSLH